MINLRKILSLYFLLIALTLFGIVMNGSGLHILHMLILISISPFSRKHRNFFINVLFRIFFNFNVKTVHMQMIGMNHEIVICATEEHELKEFDIVLV